MSIKRWMDKEDVRYTHKHNGMLLSHKKWNFAICRKVDVLGEHYAKWNKWDRKICFCTKFIKKKWNFEHEVCSGEVSPCCLRSGCPDADLKLRSWASAWFPLRFLVLSPQEFLPLTDQLETWPRASVPLSCPEPSRSSLYLLFWHPSSMEKEKRALHLWKERKEWFALNSFNVSIVQPGFSDWESAQRVPRSFVIFWSSLRWCGMTLTILYVFRKHCFLLYSFSFFPHFTLTTALKKRKVQVVLLWKCDPVIKLYCSPLPSDSDKASCFSCTHGPRLASHLSHLRSPSSSTLFCLKASYWSNTSVLQKPWVLMSDWSSNPHSTTTPPSSVSLL